LLPASLKSFVEMAAIAIFCCGLLLSMEQLPEKMYNTVRSVTAMPDITLPSMISDGMIVQHGEEFPLNGHSQPLSAITVIFLNKTYRTIANAAGNWQVLVAPTPPGGPFIMEIMTGTGAHRVINDIYAGDVWLCSGQSNMELSMARLKDTYPEEFTATDFPCIREFRLPYATDFTGPQEEMPEARWLQASAHSLLSFSGTGWFFAKNLYEAYHIPIGLVVAAAGGAPIEAFMSREVFSSFSSFSSFSFFSSGDFPETIARSRQYADPVFREHIIKQNESLICAWEDTVEKSDIGVAEAWFLPSTDDSAWSEMTVPGDFASRGGIDFADFCGVVWLRKTVYIPPAFAGKEAHIWLGTIVDADTVYINGSQVGNTTYRYPPRKYSVPAGLLHAGQNHLAIRVVCNDGQGGITMDKPFYLWTDTPEEEKEKIELAGTWKYHVGVRCEPRPAGFFIHWQATGLFNAMISPVLRYPLKGVIWYQGESNIDRPEDYARFFPAMIQDWRSVSRKGVLPFILVQLPLFGKPEENTMTSAWAALRKAQGAALQLPGTAMVCALDTGEWNDLHPVNKKTIGYRLALAARSMGRCEAGFTDSPRALIIVRGCGSDEGRDLLYLGFDNCKAGLVAHKPLFVSILTKDKKLVRLPADIDGHSQLRVDITSIPEPEMVLYAWADNPIDCGLYNSDGFPALPFCLPI
jgi:sialate O-acetylesterase